MPDRHLLGCRNELSTYILRAGSLSLPTAWSWEWIKFTFVRQAYRADGKALPSTNILVPDPLVHVVEDADENPSPLLTGSVEAGFDCNMSVIQLQLR